MEAFLRTILLGLLGCAACAIYPPGPATPSGGAAATPAVEKEHPWLTGLRLPAYLRRPAAAQELAIAADVELLLGGGFDAYPSAAQRLVLRGEIVAPYLGHAALHHEAPAEGKERILFVLQPVYAEAPPEHLGAGLASPYPSVRIAAATCVGDRRFMEHGSRLVSLLDDPELEVRRAAVTSLRRMTNAFFGYRPEDPPSRRREAIARWREFWDAG